MPLDLFVGIWEHKDMDTLENIRIRQGLTYEKLGRLAGYSRSTAFQHCNRDARLSTDAAVRYSAALGIPLSELRPDLPQPVTATPTSTPAPVPPAGDARPPV